jgi:hypothetical protein
MRRPQPPADTGKGHDMNRLIRRLATVCVAATVTVLALSAGASAAGTTGQTASAVDTISVPCTSPVVWLRLWSSVGERCYAGNGVTLVNLPDVNRGQVIGLHTVCLYTRTLSARCVTGPRAFTIVPPIWVVQIRIGAPVV